MAFQYAGIDHVQVAVPKGTEPEVRKFYGELLGMPELEKPEPLKSRGGAWFVCGVQQLHIGVEDEFTPAKKAHPAFVLENLDALRDHLLANGVTVKDDKELSDRKRFFVNDPWGNRLEFMEMLQGV